MLDGCGTASIRSTASRIRPQTSGSSSGPELGGIGLVTYTAGHVVSKRAFDDWPTLEDGVCSCGCHRDLHGTGGGSPRAGIN